MELKIYSPQERDFVQAITWNNEEIKAEVAEKVQHYKSLVYTETEIKAAKADRATLNKFVTALENKRKEVKKQCMAPYEQFEAQIKEIIAIVNEPIQLIDTQIKNFEEKKKAEKLAAIQTFFDGLDKPFDGLTLEQIFNQKWLNASASFKTVCAEIDDILQQIAVNLDTLAKLPDFAFESIEVYKDTLDINKAIQEGQRLADIQRRKAEAERAAQAAREQQEKQAAAQQPETVTGPDDEQGFTGCNTGTAPQRQVLAFKARLTVRQAISLKNFFKANNIEFAPIVFDTEKVTEILTSYFNSVYCDTCAYDSPYGQPECDECHRKAMNWALSEASAAQVAEMIKENCF